MSKKLKPIPATASVRVIPRTSYVIIDGDKVAKLLTPTFQGKDDAPFYNLFVAKSKKYARVAVADLASLSKSDVAELIADREADDETPTPATK